MDEAQKRQPLCAVQPCGCPWGLGDCQRPQEECPESYFPEQPQDMQSHRWSLVTVLKGIISALVLVFIGCSVHETTTQPWCSCSLDAVFIMTGACPLRSVGSGTAALSPCCAHTHGCPVHHGLCLPSRLGLLLSPFPCVSRARSPGSLLLRLWVKSC